MAKQQPSANQFRRDPNGTVRIRMRFGPEEADLIEEAAGDTPLVTYMKRVLLERAKVHAEKAGKERQRRLQEEM